VSAGRSRRLSVAFVALVVATLTALAWAGAAGAQISDQNQRCFECHAKADLGTITVDGEQRSLTVDPVAYRASQHGLIDCTGCHIGFKPQAHTEAETEDWLYTARVTACGTCHGDIAAVYAGSTHGQENAKRGEGDATPDCATCHGSHEIATTDTDAFRRYAVDTCSSCHGGRSGTYLDTYHGKSFALGRPEAAACFDCHTAHGVLPADDPNSAVSSQNVVATCGECHADANDNFSSYLVHVNAKDPRDSVIVFMTYAFYATLIAVMFTLGGVHSVMYFYRGRKQGMYRRRHEHE